MTKIAVIGLGFGDEGKGMVTGSLANHFNNPLVVRYSGGHQAGHTVVHGGVKHVFSNLGSGTLQGVPTYWSDECTVDPVGICNELAALSKELHGEMEDVKLFLNRKAPVTTPYDMEFNRQHEKDMMHGTCGVGFGMTLQREEENVHFLVEDLFNPTILKIKLEIIKRHYGFVILREPGRDLDAVGKFMSAIRHLQSWIDDHIVELVNRIPAAGFSNIIYEGSQGLLLDQGIGFFPHVTRSHVGSRGLVKSGFKVDEIYYVTRAYQTRHGEGPMTNEDHLLKLTNWEEETNQTHEWQGEFRRTVLDLDLLIYALKHDRRFNATVNKSLVITCLDQMTEWKFTRNGELVYANTEEEFVALVATYLGFGNNVYLSRSEKCGIDEWKGGNNDD